MFRQEAQLHPRYYYDDGLHFSVADINQTTMFGQYDQMQLNGELSTLLSPFCPEPVINDRTRTTSTRVSTSPLADPERLREIVETRLGPDFEAVIMPNGQIGRWSDAHTLEM
ncbi:hypothetical protein VKT23_004627 [Stygiomarasmius scandens]|uniref:Uncharacterized protein n=1 Tax=Marasmiellus scandens TaxID=2682957 RepID=A0ABR1JVI6_9AGAR